MVVGTGERGGRERGEGLAGDQGMERECMPGTGGGVHDHDAWAPPPPVVQDDEDMVEDGDDDMEEL